MPLFVTRKHLIPPRRGLLRRKVSKTLLPAGRTTKVLRLAGLALFTVGLYLFIQIGFTDIQAGFSQRELKGQWRKINDNPSMSDTAKKTPDTVHRRMRAAAQHDPVSPGAPFARIVIQKIQLDTIVVEGVSEQCLALGPGHMEGTGYPGEYGNMVISGHRVTYSRPFYNLDTLIMGDPIEIYVGTQKFTYYVTEKKIVVPTDISVTDPTQDKTLTLTTCNPRFSANTRLVVVAKIPEDNGE